MAIVPRPDDSSRSRAPKPGQVAVEFLGLSLPVTERDVKQAYFRRAQDAHPDRGGSAADFQQVQQAFEEALEYARQNGKRLPWLGALVPVYAAQRDAIDLVERCGGKCVIEVFEWLAGTVGDDFAALGDRLKEIDLSGAAAGDEELLLLTSDGAHLPHLEAVNLAGTEVTDRGAAGLARLPALRRLDLRGTRVSFAERRRLARLPGVERAAGASRWEEFFGRGRR